MDLPKDGDIEAGLRKMIYQAVHDKDYKHGASKTQITPSTDSLAAMKIFIASSIITAADKSRFRTVEHAIVYHRRWHNSDPDAFAVISRAMSWLRYIFEDDHIRRNTFLPTILQRYNEDGSIDRTVTVDVDGNVESVYWALHHSERRPAKDARASEDEQEESDAEKEEITHSSTRETTDHSDNPSPSGFSPPLPTYLRELLTSPTPHQHLKTDPTSAPEPKQKEEKQTNAAKADPGSPPTIESEQKENLKQTDAAKAANAAGSAVKEEKKEEDSFGNDFARHLRRGFA
jgi:hypothetical protein